MELDLQEIALEKTIPKMQYLHFFHIKGYFIM